MSALVAAQCWKIGAPLEQSITFGGLSGINSATSVFTMTRVYRGDFFSEPADSERDNVCGNTDRKCLLMGFHSFQHIFIGT